MRFRNVTFMCVLVLFFTLFLRSSTGCIEEEDLAQVQEKIIAKMIVANENMEKKAEKMRGLAKQIVIDNEKLSEFFQKREFKHLAELLEKHSATLITEGYKRKCGKESAQFWCTIWKEGAVLKFKPVNIYLSDVIEERRELKEAEGKEEVVFDCAACVIQEIHIIAMEEGKISHNDTFLGMWSYRHQDACPWF